MNSSPARRASSGLRPIGLGDLRGDYDAQPVRNHDEQLVAPGMAETVVDHLEAVEVDEQHGAAAAGRRVAEQLVRFGTEMQPVRKRRDRVVHAQGLRILDRRADFGEQSVHRRGQLGHVLLDERRRGRNQVAILDGKQPVAQRCERAGAFAVGTLRRDVADQQAEGAGDDRRDDLIVEVR